MGCILARRKFVANDDIEGQDRAALEVFRELGLTDSEVDLLYTAFHDIDADGSSKLSYE